MAIKIGHASIDERGKASGGAAGDQTGGEVCIRTWYFSPWDVVLRPKSAELAEKSARACEAACANNKIGYDQISRNTLYRYAKLVDFDLSKITDACECDCSSLMHVCAIAGGAKLSYGINGLVTWNMVEAFEASGDYEKLTEGKYINSDTYLKRGDILVKTSGHTAMALEDGAKAEVESGVANPPVGSADSPLCKGALESPTTGAVMLTPLPLLKKGSMGRAVWSMQTILTSRGYSTQGIDGDFGPNTLAALLLFQSAFDLEADGECGSLTWGKLIGGYIM